MKYDLEQFKGITVALYACFDEEGNVSKERTKKLCRHYKEKGVNGLYVCGSSGEGFLLSTKERMEILEAVMEEVGSEMTIIVHVGAAATKDAVELAKHAELMKAHAVSAVPNVYYKIPERSIERHWNAIIDSSNLPFIIYNIPQTTGYNLSLNLLKTMAANPKVIGIKNTSMSGYDMYQFKRWTSKDFLLFNGPDEQYLAGRIMGAEAGIGGTYGVMPELFIKLEELFRQNKIDEARELQYAINNIIDAMISFPSLYGAAKALLRLRGIDIGEPRLPLEPICEKDPEIIALNERIMNTIHEYC